MGVGRGNRRARASLSLCHSGPCPPRGTWTHNFIKSPLCGFSLSKSCGNAAPAAPIAAGGRKERVCVKRCLGAGYLTVTLAVCDLLQSFRRCSRGWSQAPTVRTRALRPGAGSLRRQSGGVRAEIRTWPQPHPWPVRFLPGPQMGRVGVLGRGEHSSLWGGGNKDWLPWSGAMPGSADGHGEAGV